MRTMAAEYALSVKSLHLTWYVNDVPFLFMVIFETTVFTKIIQSLMADEDYRLLQNHLIELPEAGSLIKGSGGLRKIRWKLEGRGKRGGIRVVYYWATTDCQIFMLVAYPKNEQENLTQEQLSVLKKLIESEFEK